MNSIGILIEVILYVQDMARQVVFYRDMLGLKVRTPNDTDNFDQVSWVEFETGTCALALHGGGTAQMGRDASKIVFRVSDLAAVRSTLAHKISLSEIRSPAPGVWVCDGTDPEGNKFSIEQRGQSA